VKRCHTFAHIPPVRLGLFSNNDFILDGEWYLRTCGTAMGNGYAPPYADIFKAKFEREALLKCKHEPNMFLIYPEDIFIIWPHSSENSELFLQIFNEHLPPIKFNFIDHLDPTVSKDPTDPSDQSFTF